MSIYRTMVKYINLVAGVSVVVKLMLLNDAKALGVRGIAPNLFEVERLYYGGLFNNFYAFCMMIVQLMKIRLCYVRYVYPANTAYICSYPWYSG